MKNFFPVWLTQTISILGSKLTEFAMGVWVLEQTGSTTQFALMISLFYIPGIIISPIAGTIADRWNRKWSMVLGDGLAGIVTLIVMALVYTDHLALWHIYIAVFVSCSCNALHIPAYTAAIPQLVEPQHCDRANGMVQMSTAIAKLSSPLIAGFLFKFIRLEGILLVDIVTFTIAFATLIVAKFPNVINFPVNNSPKERPNFKEQITSGWHYIRQFPGLTQLMMLMATTFLSLGTLEVLLWPYILSFTSSEQLGILLSCGGLGMLCGSISISIWGTPRRKIFGILVLLPLQGLLTLYCGIHFSLPAMGIALFGYLFSKPIITTCNLGIWHKKTPLHLQGRVFALQHMLEKSLAIVACLITGPIVDYGFTPFKETFLPNLQTTGSGLVIALVGIGNIIVAAFFYRQPRLIRLEAEIPDGNQVEPKVREMVNA
jgi:MFS family permease